MYAKTVKRIILICCAVNLVNSDAGIEFRIVGGSPAGKEEFPFVVSIQSRGFHFCGGTLIAKDWVLSAAKCFYGNESPLTAVLGADKLDSNESTRIPVAYIVTHGDYNPQSFANNIALAKLDKPITESKFIEIIELSQNYIYEDEDCIAVGWGYTKYPSSRPSNELHLLKTKTMSAEKCQEELKEFGTLFEADICTFNKKDEGFCGGDLGSPLVIKTEKKFKQIAIINWGVPCGKGVPDVSSRISYYYDWIQIVLQNY